jgi:hypothetical protein
MAPGARHILLTIDPNTQATRPPGSLQFWISPPENQSMRGSCWMIGAVALACTLAGCGESAPEGGPVDFKATSSPAIEALRKQMSENMKNQAHLKSTPETKPAAESKPTDSKSAPSSKAAEKK